MDDPSLTTPGADPAPAATDASAADVAPPVMSPAMSSAMSSDRPPDISPGQLDTLDRFGRLAGLRLIEVEAEQAIRAAGGVPALLLPHLLPRLGVVQEGDRLRVVALAAGDPIGAADLVAELRRDPALAAAFPNPAPRGGGAVESPRAALPPGAVSLWDQDAINRHQGDIAAGRMRVVDR